MSKNHWLQVHEEKTSRFWTAEFLGTTKYFLKPRRVKLQDFKKSVQGEAIIVFEGAMTNSTDFELLDFLNYARQNMLGWRAHFRAYLKLLELEHFEIQKMSYRSIGIGPKIDDVKLELDYGQLWHHQS